MRPRVSIEKRLAACVRELRERHGLSQLALARLAHTSRSQVTAIEQGDKVPTIATVEAFARALGVTISELVGEVTPRPASKTRGSGDADRLALALERRGSEYVAAVERIITVLDRFAQGKARPGHPGSGGRQP